MPKYLIMSKKVKKNLESKAERFVRILSTRLSSTNVAIDRLSKMGNKYYFDYTQEQANAVIKEVEEGLDYLKKSFGINNKINTDE